MKTTRVGLPSPATRVLPLLAALAILLAIATPSRGQDSGFATIVPGIREGDTFSTVPFTGSPNSARFQQVYDSAAFTFFGQRPYLIHELQFRTDGDGTGFFSRFPGFQINMSTTTRPVDGLSAIFAENVGRNDATVIPFGPYQVTGGYFSDIRPQLFTTVITFSTPFYYDPSQGNLLLDIRNSGGGSTGWGIPPFFGPAYVDAVNVTGDSVSSVAANNVNALSGTPSSLGLVTRFMVTPVPEPSTFALLLVGLVAFGFSARSRQTRKE